MNEKPKLYIKEPLDLTVCKNIKMVLFDIIYIKDVIHIIMDYSSRHRELMQLVNTQYLSIYVYDEIRASLIFIETHLNAFNYRNLNDLTPMVGCITSIYYDQYFHYDGSYHNFGFSSGQLAKAYKYSMIN